MRTSPASVSPRAAGVAYLVASTGFILVFAWLAAKFGYPDVLDLPAAEVLPKLLSLGAAGRTVWVIYALLPLLLIPAGLGAAGLLQNGSPRGQRAARLAGSMQMVAAVAMTIGLVRWSTLQWGLAESWVATDLSQHAEIVSRFDAYNLYLGNTIGEFAGELALYGSFLAFAIALLDGGRRKMAALAAITGVFGSIGMFRNITAVVQPASDVTNNLLPVFLIAFGIMLVRERAAP